MPERIPAKKCRIADIANAKFFPGSKEELKPSYVITDFGEKISRVNLVASVTEKFQGEDGNYVSLTVDDESSAIRTKGFGADAELLRAINVGDLVRVVGRIKNFNNENYITTEAVSRITDSNFENLHKLEVLKELIQKKKVAEELRNLRDQLTEEELVVYAKEKFGIDKEALNVLLEGKKFEIDYKPKILEVIKRLDSGDGVEVSRLVEFLNLPDNVIESALNELLASGALYEPTIGKLKKV